MRSASNILTQQPYAYLLVASNEDKEYLDPSGERGIYGQLFAHNGSSVSERLLHKGSASPAVNGPFSDQLHACYNSIQVADTSADVPSACGVINAGRPQNPVKASQFELVSVSALSSDFVVVTVLEGVNAGREIGIKLHGVTSEGVQLHRVNEGRHLINSLCTPNAHLLLAGQNCIFTNPSGDQATLGQLFSLDGTSINEALLASGAVLPSNNGCSANKLTSCYQDIPTDQKEESQPAPDPLPDSESEDDQVHNNEYIDNFLWKPVSENTGTLVILVNPKGARVKVEGDITEELVNTGPSNGRGTTARGSRSGCGYGRNIKVSFFNAKGERILIKGGSKSVKISNGCDRVEWRI